MSCVNRISRTVLLLLSLASTVGFSMDLLTGVSPDLVAFFNAHETLTFKCLTSSQDIPWESVNDDYCDCDDGSDEPGTNACAAGQFYCANQGYEPKFLSSASP
ncbi:unnamed protein product [Cyprideis torosa]|uniref:Uncharacterized protein n=1 Tax=Cyprideis torosa TaxID=163714 RepID=A0A7R8ZX26_9CRUS|nr:unnamed protein product [Cyprideis torosa]CAG0911892.1 unnamed protein product [Cyprideis torosa]